MSNPLPPHGDWSRYVHHRCRCIACRAENSRRLKNWRQTGSTLGDATEPASNTVASGNDPTPTPEGA